MSGEYGRCGYRSPGHTEPHQAERGWNGSDICWPCWSWNKLGGPAARYWSKTLGELNIDMYDVTTYWPQAFGGGVEGLAKAHQFADLLFELREAATAQVESVS